MVRAQILGTGKYLPPKVITNDALAAMFNTSSDWIVQRTGIMERRFVDDGVGSSDLGVAAAQLALSDAGIESRDIDLVIFATLTPDIFFPGSGCLLQHKLGLTTTPALDIRNQCTGFIYGLAVAQQFIATGFYRHILLVGAETHSSGLDFSDEGRDVTVLFGDGAGAVVLGPSHTDDRGIIDVILHADGSEAESLCLIAPQCRKSRMITTQMMEQRLHFPKMNGKHVFKHAVERLPETILALLNRSGYTVDDIALFIPHQANIRINEMVSRRINIPPDRVYNNIQRYGNTTAASIPIALREALEEKRIAPGDLILFAAFGSGFTWASALVRW